MAALTPEQFAKAAEETAKGIAFLEGEGVHINEYLWVALAALRAMANGQEAWCEPVSGVTYPRPISKFDKRRVLIVEVPE